MNEASQSDFGAFFSACLDGWKALAGGAVVALLAVEAYARAASKPLDWPVYLGVTLGLLAIEAPFIAFKNERRLRLARGVKMDSTFVDDDAPLASVVDAPPQFEVESFPDPPAAPEPNTARPVRLEFTARDLVDLRSDEADIDANKTGAYVGKRLEAMLVVSKISDYPPGNCFFVYGRTSGTPAAFATHSENEWTNLTCTFDRSVWLGQLETCRAGDALRVAGEVKDIDRDGVGLIRCELLGNRRTTTEPKRPAVSD